MAELRDTVRLMLSDDYKDRFRAEYEQIFIRAEKLRKMLRAWKKGELDFTPSCPYEVLYEQLCWMDNYRDVLGNRAVIEGIDITEPIENMEGKE